MPRASRKKRALNPHKSQLLFVETPINGPKHECGPQLRSAVHPRTFISEKQGRGDAPCTSWVSPQFDLHDIKVVKGGRGRNKSSVLSLPQDRRKTVRRYSPLCLETNTAISQQRHKNLCTKTAKEVRCSRGKNDRLVSSSNPNKKVVETPKWTLSLRKGVRRSAATSVARSITSRHTEVSTRNPPFHMNGKRTSECLVHTSVSEGSQTPNTTSVPAPPNVETPEVSRCSSASPPSDLHLLFPPNQARTPPQTQNASVLVKDTPEKDYGLRVTWRRRKGLMKLLMDRGQLHLTDAGVANEWI